MSIGSAAVMKLPPFEGRRFLNTRRPRDVVERSQHEMVRTCWPVSRLSASLQPRCAELPTWTPSWARAARAAIATPWEPPFLVGRDLFINSALSSDCRHDDSLDHPRGVSPVRRLHCNGDHCPGSSHDFRLRCRTVRLGRPNAP